MAENNVLDLNELFGQAKVVKVKARDGRTYELLKMEAISPREAVRFQRLQVRAARLQGASEELTDDQADELTSIFDDLLTILCAELPVKTMQFAEKMAVIQFYMEQTQEKKAEKLALEKVRTGARRSQKSVSGTARVSRT